ncbi:hypothetical protein U1Q18_051112 [Sarracenia purpurea var. burkii]
MSRVLSVRAYLRVKTSHALMRPSNEWNLDPESISVYAMCIRACISTYARVPWTRPSSGRVPRRCLCDRYNRFEYVYNA